MLIMASTVRIRAILAGATALALCFFLTAHAADRAGRTATSVAVDKSERTLTVRYADGSEEVLGGLRFGARWKDGPKRARGDDKTPEGTYRISEVRTSKGTYKYVPAFLIDYPNAEDRAISRKLGFDPGDTILIHGPPSAMPFDMHPPGDWTDGCMALKRSQMKRLVGVLRKGTPVTILP